MAIKNRSGKATRKDKFGRKYFCVGIFLQNVCDKNVVIGNLCRITEGRLEYINDLGTENFAFLKSKNIFFNEGCDETTVSLQVDEHWFRREWKNWQKIAYNEPVGMVRIIMNKKVLSEQILYLTRKKFIHITLNKIIHEIPKSYVKLQFLFYKVPLEDILITTQRIGYISKYILGTLKHNNLLKKQYVDLKKYLYSINKIMKIRMGMRFEKCVFKGIVPKKIETKYKIK